MRKLLLLYLLFTYTFYLGAEEVYPTVSTSRIGIHWCSPTTQSVSITLFPDESWNGYTFKESGVYVCTLTNALGCDSIVTANVTVLTGTLRGRFSISPTEQVYFSKGNLQFCPNPEIEETNHRVLGDSILLGIWRFAEHQYDVMGNNNQYVGDNFRGWLDLFGFGTSGYMGKKPTMSSKASADYVSQNISKTEYDWGYYNAISNGGKRACEWFTMTEAQWTYLMNNRPNALLLHGGSSINGINGMVILPDKWELPIGCTFDPFASNYSINVYSLEQWSLMEQAGAVFLPVTGRREGYTLYYSNSYYYWTGNYYSGNTSKQFWLDGSGSPTAYSFTNVEKYRGEAVRLVRMAPED